MPWWAFSEHRAIFPEIKGSENVIIFSDPLILYFSLININNKV